MNYSEKYSEYLNIFGRYKDDYFYNLTEVPEPLYSAMKYAVDGGGKRIRPVLCFSVGEMLGVKTDRLLPYALSIEFIHSYSLVHDDLPAMDNDDYRRGKFSTHKKFGEATGILAGDALLNSAYEILLNIDDDSAFCRAASFTVATCAGAKGMIKGQILDMNSETASVSTESDLIDIQLNKTSRLIIASVMSACELSGGKFRKELSDYAVSLGLLFQTTDDIFDETGDLAIIGKTPHKDENKTTAIKIYGLEGAKFQAKKYYDNCKNALKNIPCADFLNEFTDRIYTRTK